MHLRSHLTDLGVRTVYEYNIHRCSLKYTYTFSWRIHKSIITNGYLLISSLFFRYNNCPIVEYIYFGLFHQLCIMSINLFDVRLMLYSCYIDSFRRRLFLFLLIDVIFIQFQLVCWNYVCIVLLLHLGMCKSVKYSLKCL